MPTIRPIYALALALCTFITGLTSGYVGKAAHDVSSGAVAEAAAPLAPRDEPKTAYYIGVYDACHQLKRDEFETDEDLIWECFGFTASAVAAGAYEASGE